MNVSKEQRHIANGVDLFAFLLKHHSGDVVLKYGSLLLRSDEHISVPKAANWYKDFRTGETGNNVDYLMNFLGYGYVDAVLALTEGIDISSKVADFHQKQPVPEPIQSKVISLPEAAKGQYRQLYAFLLGRGIPLDVINRLVKEKILYQSEKGNNLVFVNPERDYFETRGTNTFADKRCSRRAKCERFSEGEHSWCRLMDECPDYKKDPFHGKGTSKARRFWYFKPDSEPAERIYICEAAIDAISLYVLQQEKNEASRAVYISIGGAGNQGTIDRIVKESKGKKVILSVDNDQAGMECLERNPGLEYIVPVGKDWNEDLQRGNV